MSSDSIINTAIAAPTRRRIPLNAKRLAVGAVVGASTLLVLGGTAIAQTVDALVEEPVADLETVAKTADHAIQSGNLLWIVIGAAMVIFMQAGFALVETGFCRAKHAAHVVSTNLAVFFLGFVGFFLVGWSFMFGGYSYVLPGFDYGLNQAAGGALIGSGDWVFLWQGGWAGTWFDGGNLAYSGAAGAFFLYMVAFMDTTATIPTGSMAERWKFKSFVVWGLFCGAIYYPLFGAWTWGGGFLAKLGNSLNWGNGYVDFAGSGVVHAAGGVAALAGAIVLGPRIGKFGKDGKPRALPGHHIPMALLGTLILLFGWFGFNAASTFASSDPQIGVVAVNTALAAAFGGFVSMLGIWKRTGKPDPAAVFFIERKLKIDDPVGAISVHGVCGLLGVLAVGLVANGKYGVDAGGAGIGWNGTTTSLTDGVADGVTGLFYGGNGAGQLLSQLAGIVVLLTVILGIAFAFFKIQNALTKGGIRSSADEEVAGLDMAEMGVFAYPEFSGTHEGLVSSDA